MGIYISGASWGWPEPRASAGFYGGPKMIPMTVWPAGQLHSTWWQSEDIKITTHSIAFLMASGQAFIAGLSEVS